MSQFDYFVAFYSIVLGLSVVELLTGVARAVEVRSSLKLSGLTLMMALFVALDISSYWLQAWQLYQGAPLSMLVFTHGLVAAGAYFIAAYLVFPRMTQNAPSEEGVGLDGHFWSVRRLVFSAILLTNVLNVGTIAILTGGFSFIGSAIYTAFIATFYVACAVGALAPKGVSVILALLWLILFSVAAIGMDALAVAEAGWRVGGLTEVLKP